MINYFIIRDEHFLVHDELFQKKKIEKMEEKNA